MTKSIHVSFRPSPILHDIIIGEKLLDEALTHAKALSNQCLVITTRSLKPFLSTHCFQTLVLPDGEIIKSRAMKEKIENILIEKAFGKDCCLIAIGGGALLDLVGFVAATYCRGVAYISFPTTLLAMADAAIGGKTGLNLGDAKNWIGSFYFPRKTFIDLRMLDTLPKKEYEGGLSEIIKHSLIADAELFFYLETYFKNILKKEPAHLQAIIEKSCLIKKNVVEKDPFESSGFRRILNFGHTIAHAIEVHSGWTCSHGQAVIYGIFFESLLSHQLGYLPLSSLERIHSLLKQFSFDLNFPSSLPFELLKRDKKGEQQFVILNAIGEAAAFEGSYSMKITENQYNRVLDALLCPFQK